MVARREGLPRREQAVRVEQLVRNEFDRPVGNILEDRVSGTVGHLGAHDRSEADLPERGEQRRVVQVRFVRVGADEDRLQSAVLAVRAAEELPGRPKCPRWRTRGRIPREGRGPRSPGRRPHRGIPGSAPSSRSVRPGTAIPRRSDRWASRRGRSCRPCRRPRSSPCTSGSSSPGRRSSASSSRPGSAPSPRSSARPEPERIGRLAGAAFPGIIVGR